jgi:hypothetical protein
MWKSVIFFAGENGNLQAAGFSIFVIFLIKGQLPTFLPVKLNI